jgi:hypothetical protein
MVSSLPQAFGAVAMEPNVAPAFSAGQAGFALAGNW